MELAEALRRRHMVRRHTGEPVDPDALDRIVEAGLSAPTAGNARGVAVVRITGRSGIEAVAGIAGEPDYVARGFRPWISTAGAVVVLAADEGAYHDRYERADKDPSVLDVVPWWWFDAGAALMGMLLQAVAEDLGAGFLGAQSLPGLDDHLGIPPSVHVAGIVTLGPPTDSRHARSLDLPGPGPRDHEGTWASS
ncbi:MAG: nitroreductase family protein [Acidimicrobiia bacterium]|nr:nitroreductase family protein [Acidimicrobiia bacterium]